MVLAPRTLLSFASPAATAVGVSAARSVFARHRTLPTQPRVWPVSTWRRCNAESPQASGGVAANLANVQARIAAATAEAAAMPSRPVRLVAVGKTKPLEMIRAAYDAGHRHFGENYVQELVEKAPQMPDDVRWHFIGRMQSNKVGALVRGCPNLACIETVTSVKLARAINKAVQGEARRLKVMCQVNTSGEASKGGAEPADCVALCRFIAEECAALDLAGLMTIGAPDYSGCRTEDFDTLHQCCHDVAAALGLPAADLELSMGMSTDFERAILRGSNSVRVGSTIFGARQYDK